MVTLRREETERALQRAALDLLQRDGVLAGLNLRELADEAGVNRGLVYHYFGSRQEILRAALREDYARRTKEIRGGWPLRFRDRWRHLFRTIVRHRRAIRIATLLHLDRDAALRMMPMRDETRSLLAADRVRGDLPAELDLAALHAALNSLIYGYALFRDRFATELGCPVRELDRGVERIFARLLEGLGASGEENP